MSAPVDLPALVEAVRALVALTGHTPGPAGDVTLWAGLGQWLEAAAIPYDDGDTPPGGALTAGQRAWLDGLDTELFGGDT
jgi:hypothetical protein